MYACNISTKPQGLEEHLKNMCFSKPTALYWTGTPILLGMGGRSLQRGGATNRLNNTKTKHKRK